MCLSHVSFHIQNTIDGFPFHATNEADRMKNSNEDMKEMAAGITDVNTVVVPFVCGVRFSVWLNPGAFTGSTGHVKLMN